MPYFVRTDGAWLVVGGGDHLEVDSWQLDLLLDGIFRRYGYDFRDYARASLRRRVHTRMRKENLGSVSELQARVLRDSECMSRLLGDLSIHVTEMFRDPSFFRAIRDEVVPTLRTYPFVRIWDAGCSTGEEAYSLAIILEEEGLYDRSQIYATDMNKRVLETARSGIFRLSTMRENTQNYLAAGGTGSFSDYYTARYESAVFSPDLKRQIVFAQHNLVTDSRFNSFNLIICRNVMIYFNRDLQERVFALFHSSLERFGIIGIGKKESLRFDPLAEQFQVLNDEERIYKRTK
ncbi:MAG: protein-glutamate O-methyltransferase CheR [Acidobacteria bacterium]|nr:protein-glutamate O-methyltransferase CheR [Acidobacteriota bacterium]